MVTPPSFTVGRGDDNTLCLSESMVSRYHAEIIRIGDDFLLRDHGSTNGTYVNGERVSEQILTRGDVVRFGKGGPELEFERVVETDLLGGAAPPRPDTTESLADSLVAILEASTSSPNEEAKIRCLLAEAQLKKGEIEAANETLGIYRNRTAIDALDETHRAAVALAVGNASVESKRYAEAQQMLRHAIELSAQLGDQAGLAEAQAALGRALLGASDLLGARDTLHRALLMGRRAGNDVLCARVHLWTGKIDWKEGDLDGARYQWTRAARLAERTSDAMLEAQVQLQQAFVYYSEGRFAEAVPAYNLAIRQIEAIGNVRLLLKAYSSLSRVLTRQGSWLATERLLAPRLELARTHHLRKAEAVALTDEAELRLLQGRVADAQRIVRDAIARHQRTVYARTQRIFGRVLAHMGAREEAIRELERGLVAARVKGSLEEQVLVGLELAQVLVEVGDLERAAFRLDEAESITSLDPALALMGRALYTRGALLAAQGHAADSNRSYTQSLAIFQSIGDPYRVGLAHAALGDMRWQMGRHASARAHLEEARDLFARLGAAADLSAVRDRLASTVLLGVAPAMTNQLALVTAGGQTAPQQAQLRPHHEPASAEPLRVLLAASDTTLAGMLERGLEVENYQVDRVEHGRAALERSLSEEGAYALLLLDALLEFQSGFDVCRELRKRELEVPIILLGSRQSVEDKIDALHVGADDYLCQRGIVLEELLAKMEALLR